MAILLLYMYIVGPKKTEEKPDEEEFEKAAKLRKMPDEEEVNNDTSLQKEIYDASHDTNNKNSHKQIDLDKQSDLNKPVEPTRIQDILKHHND